MKDSCIPMKVYQITNGCRIGRALLYPLGRKWTTSNTGELSLLLLVRTRFPAVHIQVLELFISIVYEHLRLKAKWDHYQGPKMSTNLERQLL